MVASWTNHGELNLAMDGSKVARIAASMTRSWTTSCYPDYGDLDLARDELAPAE